MNTDIDTPIAFPEMSNAQLTPADIDELFDDIATCTEVLDIVAKSGAATMSDPTPLTLAAARARLLSGQVRAIQLRYRYQEAEWRDTLIATSDHFRLCRIKLDT